LECASLLAPSGETVVFGEAELRIGEKETASIGRRGIWRASFPALAVMLRLLSPRRRPRPKPAQPGGRRWKPPAPVLTTLVAVMLFAQASALPVHIGLLLLPPHTAAMTHGCDQGTCCTPLCFLDKHGIHHCVHMAGDSCDCAISTDDCTTNPVFLSAIVTAPNTGNLFPGLVPVRWIPRSQALFEGRTPATPTPPPK
jgi:hypothetical protein